MCLKGKVDWLSSLGFYRYVFLNFDVIAFSSMELPFLLLVTLRCLLKMYLTFSLSSRELYKFKLSSELPDSQVKCLLI
jgi:hypothetical protein